MTILNAPPQAMRYILLISTGERALLMFSINPLAEASHGIQVAWVCLQPAHQTGLTLILTAARESFSIKILE